MAREERRLWGVRQTVSAALILTAALTFLPALAIRGEPVYRRAETGELPNGEVLLPAAPASSAVQAGARDKGRVVRLLTREGTVEELSMADYLWGVVAAEMPASFEEEALKAQACAARTYTTVLQNSSKHPDADICGDSTCCQAYIERSAAEARWGLNAGAYEEKISQAVAQTDGLGVLFTWLSAFAHSLITLTSAS